jgi:hypothetical protein
VVLLLSLVVGWGVWASTIKMSRAESPAASDESGAQKSTAAEQTRLKRMEESLDELLQAQDQLKQRFAELSEELRIIKVRVSR